MTWFVIYETANGNFVALTDYSRDPLPTGFSAKSVGTQRPDMDAYTWDPSTIGLVSRTPQRLITRAVFINRFTDVEVRAFLGFPLDSTKSEAQRKIVDSLRWYTGSYMDMINLDDPRIVSGVTYLETTAGVLAAGRAAQILS